MNININGTPRTKKNSQQIFTNKKTGKPFIAPSVAFKHYEDMALWQIRKPAQPIDYAVNVKCVYYMPTKRRCDLVNLLEATCDILVKAKVIEDDNCNIVYSHDGSYVVLGSSNPRCEIFIEKVE